MRGNLLREMGGRLVATALAVALLALASAAGAGATGSLYVSSQTAGAVAQYSIGAGGALAPKSPLSVGATSSHGLSITPNGSSLFATSSSGTTAMFTVGAGGLLSSKSPSTVAGAGWRGAVSPDGLSFYVPRLAALAQFDVSPATGQLSPKTPATLSVPGASLLSAALTPDGKSLYAAGSTKIFQFDVAANGTLTPKTPASIDMPGTSIASLAVHPNGLSLYAGDFAGPGGVRQFDIDSAGLLSPKTPASVPAGSQAAGIAISPDGKNLYAAGFGSNTVAQFDVVLGDALVPKLPATLATGEAPIGVAVSPDGTGVYVTNNGPFSDGTTLSQFGRVPGGALAPLSPATVTTPAGPWWMAVSPNQPPKAAWTVQPNRPGAPVKFNAGASVDPDGTIVAWHWDFGDGQTADTTGPLASHVYARRGTYVVSLTLTDELGCSTRIVFTGQQALCNGNAGARKSRAVSVPPKFEGVVFRSRRAVIRNGRARVQLRCRATVVGKCFGKLVLRDHGRLIGQATFTIAAGRSKTLPVRLTARALASSRRAAATAKAHDRFGTRKTTRATLTLVR